MTTKNKKILLEEYFNSNRYTLMRIDNKFLYKKIAETTDSDIEEDKQIFDDIESACEYIHKDINEDIENAYLDIKYFKDSLNINISDIKKEYNKKA